MMPTYRTLKEYQMQPETIILLKEYLLKEYQMKLTEYQPEQPEAIILLQLSNSPFLGDKLHV